MAGALAAAAPVAVADCVPLPTVGEACAGDYTKGGSCDHWRSDSTGINVRALGLGAGAIGYPSCTRDHNGPYTERGFVAGARALSVGGYSAWYVESRDGAQTCHTVVLAEKDAGGSFWFERDLGCPAGPPPDMPWGSMLPALP